MPPADSAKSLKPQEIGYRRYIFGSLVLISWFACVSLAASVVASGQWSILLGAILFLFACQLPWPIIGFWNATIGFLITQFSNDPLALCSPPAKLKSETRASTTTAVLMCIRNEDTQTVFARLNALIGELVATGQGSSFSVYILSDTSVPSIGEAEEVATAALKADWGQQIAGITYRRRAINTGFKAGNIRDFCLTFGGSHDYALVLDADSFMSGDKIMQCVSAMDENPTLGILQCLTVGLPSLSPLARLFQFGMRLGMRAYTLGSSWWQADCGPYWGHNAIIRLQPFTAYCDLPQLPGRPPFGGDILSHDQIEAVLMRRAGFEVRVIPLEGGSYEENPPTTIEFIRRDLRWCLGNLQYFALLGMPGLKVTSRVQLCLAIWMFLSAACNVGFWSLLLLQSLLHPTGDWIERGPAFSVIGLMIVLTLVQKCASALAVLLNAVELRTWGGPLRFLTGFVMELLFSIILTPIMQLSETAAIVMLCFGQTIGWQAQNRSEHAIPWWEAFVRFWPHTVVGLVVGYALSTISPMAAVWSLPVYGGLLLAIPLSVVTSSPKLGAWMAGAKALAIPEDIDPPDEIKPLQLPALAIAVT